MITRKLAITVRCLQGNKENKLLVKEYKQMSEYLEKIRLLRKRKERVVIAIVGKVLDVNFWNGVGEQFKSY